MSASGADRPTTSSHSLHRPTQAVRRSPFPHTPRLRYSQRRLFKEGRSFPKATGLSLFGSIRPIVPAYRRARLDCSTHEIPNVRATEVLVGFGPSIDFDKGRRMADAMLVYIEARIATGFGRACRATGRSPASCGTSCAWRNGI
jgi:hypothetical protein